MPRPSPVRDAVTDVLRRDRGHGMSIDALLGRVRAGGHSADFSSVFRAVRRLTDEGLLEKVQLGDGTVHYEWVGEHHDHVVCTSCGRVEAVPSCPIGETHGVIERRTGFDVRDHHLLFTGLCPTCAHG